MTEEQFTNLAESDFLEIWEIFRKESKLYTKNSTPIGFGQFLKEKYNIDIDSVTKKHLNKLSIYTSKLNEVN